MSLAGFRAQGLRSFSSVHLDLSPGINLFWGSNGTGKTSLLEGVHILSTGKSFRTDKLDYLVRRSESKMQVASSLRATTGPDRELSLVKPKGKPGEARVQGQRLSSVTQLAGELAVAVFNAEAVEVLTGVPSNRRRFFDRGVFHVEPEFLGLWRLSAQLLKQRNALLRNDAPDGDFGVWEHRLADVGERLAVMRQGYVEGFREFFHGPFAQLSGGSCQSLLATVGLQLSPGWNEERGLLVQLAETRARDRKLGHTSVGPHRANVQICFDQDTVKYRLSRGELKLLMGLVTVAQGEFIRRRVERPFVYLLDDIRAELDADSADLLCGVIERTEAQVLCTAIAEDDLDDFWKQPERVAKFHVEPLSCRVAVTDVAVTKRTP